VTRKPCPCGDGVEGEAHHCTWVTPPPGVASELAWSLVPDVFNRASVSAQNLARRIDAALIEARRQQDRVWIREAERGFEGVRDPQEDPSLIDGWRSVDAYGEVASFVLHEVWKRSPRVEPLNSRLAGAEKLLADAAESLEYVERAHPGTTGSGIRVAVAWTIRTFLAESRR